jgi:lipoprotein-anchoring transpeptidase ErfK/SrfK
VIRSRRGRASIAASIGIVTLTAASPLLADDIVSDARVARGLPPWTEVGDVPMPQWARSVVPNKAESAIYAEAGKLEMRRGSAQPGARLPLFATRRAGGCMGRWLNVGPLAWMCSDVGDYSGDDPVSPSLGTRPWVSGANVNEDQVRPSRPGTRGLPPLDPAAPTDDGLPYRYYFAGRDGAYGFANLATALDDAPDQELEPGFAVAILEEQSAHGERWGKTKKGRWVAMRELVPTRANVFHGELFRSDPSSNEAEPFKLDVAWVVSEKASVFSSEKADKASGTRVRFEKVHVYEEHAGKDPLVRVSADNEPAAWMRARDVSRARLMAPPPEVTIENERWIDVDLAQQTLVAYEGKRPVFATIVSTGKGALGSEFVTHQGTFRIWVKVFTTKMDNLDKEEVDRHYAIEDVPWVQFFDKAIALHGAFWHNDFGHVHSHGCVNMAPLDARWVFAFTSPHLPTGWTAVLPTKIEQGAVVRVR